MNVILEMAVYCGRLKVWRILNINTGTIYSVDYPEKEQAEAAIEHGTLRSDAVVVRVTKDQMLKLFINQ